MRWTLTELGLKDNNGWLVGPPPPQDVLVWLYLKSKQDGTLPKVFYQGVPDARQFIDWYSQREGKEVIVLGAWHGDGSLAGIGFVNGVERIPNLVKAETGFLFCREVSVFTQIDLMRAMISLLFLKTDIDCILGTTPTPNHAACAMVKRLGLRTFEMPMYATWDGEPCSALLSQTDKKTWFNVPQNNYLAPSTDHV
jgi:hypothetical protein